MSDPPQPPFSATSLLLVKLLIAGLFVYPLLHYSFLEKLQSPAPLEPPEVIKVPPLKPPVRRRPLPPQPTCAWYEGLETLCEEVYVSAQLCTPQDVDNLEKHKAPPMGARNSTVAGEPRGTIVGCIAAGLLLTSLGAAFVELYKAKAGGSPRRNKTPISRKCSLADLTVLKHSRKEMGRRESIMEVPEPGPKTTMGRPPLYRRSSFPVDYEDFSDNRRPSISRRGSIDDSPERRHWTRLVHRH